MIIYFCFALIGLIKRYKNIENIFIPVILFYDNKNICLGLYDDFYTHCFFQKLFLVKCVGFAGILFKNIYYLKVYMPKGDQVCLILLLAKLFINLSDFILHLNIDYANEVSISMVLL